MPKWQSTSSQKQSRNTSNWWSSLHYVGDSCVCAEQHWNYRSNFYIFITVIFKLVKQQKKGWGMSVRWGLACMYVYENGYDASEDEHKQVKKIPILGPTTISNVYAADVWCVFCLICINYHVDFCWITIFEASSDECIDYFSLCVLSNAFFKKYEGLLVPGHDVINIVYSSDFFLLFCASSDVLDCLM